jgi:hypothetical protein
MNSVHDIAISFNKSDPFGNLVFVLRYFLFPILVAILTYIVVDRLGEWRKRRMYSKLGVVIMESLQEELRTGIKTMKEAWSAANDPHAEAPPRGLLPNKSWSGMQTIPDEVLLRILEASSGLKFIGLPPREIRSHCKNFFTHMNENYQNALNIALARAARKEDWRTELKSMLVGSGEPYLEAASSVERLLEETRLLLVRNSHRLMPK